MTTAHTLDNLLTASAAQISSCVEPRHHKKDLCNLIKLLHNCLYLQLHKAGNGDHMAERAEQRGHYLCPLLHIVPQISEQGS